MQSYAHRTAADSRDGRIRFIIYAISVWILVGTFPARMTAASDNYTQGMAALRSGEYEKARQHFESALNDKTNQEESRAGLLRVLRITGRYQEAVKRSEEFLLAHGASALLLLEGGRIHTATGDYARAEAHLRQSMILAPRGSTEQMDATRALAELLEQIGRAAEARQLWNRLIQGYKPGSLYGSQRLGDIAVAAWRQGYIQDAKDIFIDATDPKRGEVSLEALVNFGYLFLEKYNATDAMEIFKECLGINKSFPDALIGMARAKKYENDLEVEVYSRAALNVNPNLVSARILLAELAMEDENLFASRQEINAALSVNPSSLESLTLQAVYHYFSGDMAGFEKAEKRIFEINPSYGRFYYTLAESLVSRRKYQESLNFYRKAIALDPKLWPAYASLGMNLTRIGNLKEGREAIQQAFEGDPFNIWAFNSLKLLDQMDTFTQAESEHFSYLMSAEDRAALSSYASELAEEAYAKLTERYDFIPDGPLQIEVFPDHGGFAVRTLGLPGLGGALGVCFGKVIAIDSPRARKAGTFNWGTTLWHEFAHVITLQMTNHNIPRWFSEGLSVYEEHKARPGWGDNLDISFIKAYKEGELLKASELNMGFTRPENPGQISLAYYQAALVCEWMEQKYGFEKIKQSLRLFAENMPAEEVFLQTLGLDSAGMDEEYARFIDSRIQGIASNIYLDSPDIIPRATSSAEVSQGALVKLLRDNPNDFFANLKMGTQLRASGDNRGAETYLKKAQTLFPHYVEPGNPYQLLGQIYIETQREDEALAEFEKWIRMNGDSVEPLVGSAEIYSKRKDWESVVKMLNLIVYINPYDLDIQKRLGEAALESENWDAAVAAYRVIVDLDSTDPAGAHYDLARALLASGNKQEAKREVLRSLEIAPSYLRAQKLLLKISEGTGE